ncbi:MAG: O-antigen ligase family protein [Firmicutes bacterium]|nr:O-antigen ligase family protein [Bacillota bacterium]
MAKTYSVPLPPSKAFLDMGTDLAAAPKSRLSPATVLLFLALASYVALPFFKIPIFDLSLSAVIFAFICLNIFLGSGLAGLGEQKLWTILALWLWIGVLFSLAGHSVSGLSGKIDLGNWLMFLRLSYWMLVFVLIAFISTEANAWERLVKVLGVMICLTALARWGEIALFGNIGAWSGTKLQTQNNYGILFSTYTPFLLVPVFTARRGRALLVLALMLVWGAIALNGSRGSWVAVGLATAIFCLMYFKISHRIMPLVGFGLLSFVIALALLMTPGKFQQAVTDRASSFQDLDRDKSWNTRMYQLHKGWELFKEHGFAGVGRGGFTGFVLGGGTERADVSVKTLSSRSAHNAYIAYLAETGLAGTMPFALLLIFLTWRGYKAAIWWGRRQQFWALAVYLSFLSMSVHLWVLQGLYNTSTWLVYGLTAGMISAAARVAREPQTSQDKVA